LFNTVIAIPVAHDGQLAGHQGARLGVDTIHIDFTDEPNLGRHCRIACPTVE
jgi:hypothetical protein